MSIQAMVWVLEDSSAEGYDRLVLLAIANHCDAHGCNAWPSYEQIAREAHVDRGTVWRCLQRLTELGEVVVTQRGRGRSHRNQYRLPMKQSRSATLSPEMVALGAVKGRGEAPEMVALTRLEPSFNRPEPSRVRARVREGAGPGSTPPGPGPEGEGKTTHRPRAFVPDPPVTAEERERARERVAALRRGEG